MLVPSTRRPTRRSPTTGSDPMEADRNLLFGVLALRNGLIDDRQFVEACHAWSAGRGATFAEIVEARGWVSADDRRAVERFVDLNVKKHGGDPRTTLSAVAPGDPDDLLEYLDGTTDEATDPEEVRRGAHRLLSTIAQPGKGTETRDRYTLSHVHAKGGLGQVWLARDPALGREVALKELLPERASRADLRHRFEEEAKITGQLQHPAIVPVHELSLGREGRSPFYTMRFVDGRTLLDATKAFHAARRAGEAGPLALRGLLDAFVSVCNAVHYAHSRRVLHRDLKGSNVVLGDFGEVVVLDWGLAKRRRPGRTGRPGEGRRPGPPSRCRSTPTPSAAGRPESGSPSAPPATQHAARAGRGGGEIDERSDVYSPRRRCPPRDTHRPPADPGHGRGRPRRRPADPRDRAGAPPRESWSAVPLALAAVALKAIAKRPEDRYPDGQRPGRRGPPVDGRRAGRRLSEPWTAQRPAAGRGSIGRSSPRPPSCSSRRSSRCRSAPGGSRSSATWPRGSARRRSGPSRSPRGTCGSPAG